MQRIDSQGDAAGERSQASRQECIKPKFNRLGLQLGGDFFTGSPAVVDAHLVHPRGELSTAAILQWSYTQSIHDETQFRARPFRRWDNGHWSAVGFHAADFRGAAYHLFALWAAVDEPLAFLPDTLPLAVHYAASRVIVPGSVPTQILSE
jgi:hypothetical protein